MQTPITFQSWLDHLRCLLPVTGVLHIGSNTENAESPIYADWGVSHRFFLAADQTLPERLAGGIDSLFAEADFSPQVLNWAIIDGLPALPILQTDKLLDGVDVLIVRVALDDATVPEAGMTQSEVDLFLAAAGYLGVAMQRDEDQPSLGHVLYVRQWHAALQLRLAELQQDLLQRSAEHAVAVCALQESLRSQTTLALENRRQVEALTQARDEQSKLVNELQARLERASKALEEQTGVASDRQGQIERLTQARDEQTRLSAGLRKQLAEDVKILDDQAALTADSQKQIEQLTSALHEQFMLAGERQVHLEQLTKARDEQTHQVSDLQSQVEQLVGQRDQQMQWHNEHKKWNESLKAQKEQLEKEKQQLQEQLQGAEKQFAETLKTAETRKQRLDQLEQQVAEQNHRQRLIDEELIKADAQIELIKDALIRGKKF